MHPEILTSNQEKLLPLVKKFSKNFGLVGGTAVALHLGHRRSIDFDLFTLKKFDSLGVRRKILANNGTIEAVLRKRIDDYTLMINKVQFTFFYYPFPIRFSNTFKKTVRLPNLLTLAAMKAHALGHRNKWKDYVDLYFILQDYHSVNDISLQAKRIFKGEFNERIFREQLSYFQDIDYSEPIDYLPGYEISDKKIKQELIKLSLN